MQNKCFIYRYNRKVTNNKKKEKKKKSKESKGNEKEAILENEIKINSNIEDQSKDLVENKENS